MSDLETARAIVNLENELERTGELMTRVLELVDYNLKQGKLVEPKEKKG